MELKIAHTRYDTDVTRMHGAGRLGHHSPSDCFYPRDAMLARVFAIATCLDVWTSVTRRYCAWQSESRIVKCTPSDSAITLVSG